MLVVFAAAVWLGLVMEKQGRKREAVAELEAAARMRPDHKGIKQDLKRIKG